MSYRFTINACDGVHTRVFKSEVSALKALAKHLGFATDGEDDKPLRADRTYYETTSAHAASSRNCRADFAPPGKPSGYMRPTTPGSAVGVATKAQLALLDRHYF